jgi:hypothetical protein
MHPMKLLGDVGLVESYFGPFGDYYCRGKIGALFAPNVPQAQKSFWTHTIELLGDVCHVESYFIPFGDTDNLDAR